jgi:hypothetical protein
MQGLIQGMIAQPPQIAKLLRIRRASAPITDRFGNRSTFLLGEAAECLASAPWWLSAWQKYFFPVSNDYKRNLGESDYE